MLPPLLPSSINSKHSPIAWQTEVKCERDANSTLHCALFPEGSCLKLRLGTFKNQFTRSSCGALCFLVRTFFFFFLLEYVEGQLLWVNNNRVGKRFAHEAEASNGRKLVLNNRPFPGCCILELFHSLPCFFFFLFFTSCVCHKRFARNSRDEEGRMRNRHYESPRPFKLFVRYKIRASGNKNKKQQCSIFFPVGFKFLACRLGMYTYTMFVQFRCVFAFTAFALWLFCPGCCFCRG